MPVESQTNQQHGSGIIPRARVKTIKMTLFIVSAYVTSWSPFLIINTLVVFDILEEDVAMQSFRTLSQTFAHLNSAVNPIIYWIFNSDCRTRQPIENLDKRGSHPETTGSLGGCSSWLRLNRFFCCLSEPTQMTVPNEQTATSTLSQTLGDTNLSNKSACSVG